MDSGWTVGWGVPATVAALLLSPPVAGTAQDPGDGPLLLAAYTFSGFDGDRAGWHDFMAELLQDTGAGPLVARVTVGRRFGDEGVLFEADAYPTLGRGRYAYMNVGGSGAAFFPELRGALEVHQILGERWEASLGARQLRFDARRVTVWTGSLSRDGGRWWISGRPLWSEEGGEGRFSGTLTARRYGESARDFWGIVLGAGASAAGYTLVEDLDRSTSWSAELEGRLPRAAGWLPRWGLGVAREEFPGGEARNRLRLMVGVEGPLE